MLTNPKEFARALKSGKMPQGGANGLVGRLIRGKVPKDFETLTDDPKRKLVFLVNPSGLEALVGLSGYEQLIKIGYTRDHIQRKVVDEGNQFKLAVWREGGPAQLATWDNVLELVAQAYPRVAGKVLAQRAALKRMTGPRDFEEFEKKAGYRFADVDKAGPDKDHRFMTYERLLQAVGTLEDVRAFLYHTVHMKELYAGDGYTRDVNGQKGVLEYICLNVPVADLDSVELCDIDVVIPSTLGQTVVSRKLEKYELPMPGSYDPAKFGTLWMPNLNQIAGEAATFAAMHKLKAAATDALRVAVVPIDCQIGFCLPNGSLFVRGQSGTGAVDDNRRLAEFIGRNMRVITGIFPTMDTHLAFQMFFPGFWVNAKGEHPAPFTVISVQDVENGVWTVNPAAAGPVFEDTRKYMALREFGLHYVRELEKKGKYQLTIWPYHCLLGDIEHALDPSLNQVIFFHSIARAAQVGHQIKGGNPLTENYSPASPEVTTGPRGQVIAQRNVKFLEMVFSYDVVVIAGQAKSHCVKWFIDDVLAELLKKDATLAKRIYLLEDCTSSVVVPGVVDYTPEADAAFDRFRKAGMNVVKSTDPIHTWPGLGGKF